MPLAKKLKDKATYKDYLQWPEDVRCELIGGTVYDMTPAPSRKHQSLSGELFGILWTFLKNKTCEVYSSPFDVVLPEENEKEKTAQNVVQPDISVICDKKKLTDQGCTGAPDFIIEIASPTTASKDMKEKLDLYEKHGVKEYWIVYPEEEVVMVFTLNKEKKYGRPRTYSAEDTIKVKVPRGLTIDLKEVFLEI